MRNTFWPNRIFERQSFKITLISALLMKISFQVKTAYFGQIAFLSVKFVTLACFFKTKNSALSMKIVKTFFRSPHAQHVLPKSYFSGQTSQNFAQTSKRWKRVRFPWKLDKTLAFEVMRRRFCPNRIFQGQTSHVRLVSNSLQNGKKSALSMKIGQNALLSKKECAETYFWGWNKIVTLVSNSLQKGKTVRFSWKLYKTPFFRSCAACFGQFAFLSVKVLKIVILARNCPQNGKTVRFPWQLYKTLLSGHAQHVLAKSHFWALKFLKSSNWPQIVLKTGKQCAFHENCKKPFFRLMRSTFCPNRIFQGQTSQNR